MKLFSCIAQTNPQKVLITASGGEDRMQTWRSRKERFLLGGESRHEKGRWISPPAGAYVSFFA
jgi:hypothetical protein